MDRKYVIENRIVERYVRRELPPEEALAFEEFYLDDPETLDEIEAMELLSRPEVYPNVAPAAANRTPSSGAQRPMLAAAAGLAVGVLGALLLEDDRSAAVIGPQVFTMETVRSATAETRALSVECGAWLLLQHWEESGDPVTFEVLDASGNTLLEARTTADYDYHRILLPPELVQQGHVVRVSGASGHNDQVREVHCMET